MLVQKLTGKSATRSIVSEQNDQFSFSLANKWRFRVKIDTRLLLNFFYRHKLPNSIDKDDQKRVVSFAGCICCYHMTLGLSFGGEPPWFSVHELLSKIMRSEENHDTIPQL